MFTSIRTSHSITPNRQDSKDFGSDTGPQDEANKGVKRQFKLSGNHGHEKKKLHETRTQEKKTPISFEGRREYERDESILSRRQKQIDFGKNTLAYDRYRNTVPKDERTKDDPKTPLKHLKMNRRSWDGLIKNWKLKLHRWDAENSSENRASS